MSIEVRVFVDDEEVQAALKRLGHMPDHVFSEIRREVEDLARAAIATATRTWEHKPEVEASAGTSWMGMGQYALYVTITPTGTPYRFVDQGTRGPYPIVAKRARWLAFHADYQAKTGAPAQLEAGPGGPSGPMVFRQRVMHPGIKPRHITERAGEFVEREIGPIFVNTVIQEVDSAWR